MTKKSICLRTVVAIAIYLLSITFMQAQTRITVVTQPMFTDNTIIIINTVCIIFLVLMLVILAAATRMKGGASWVAVIIVVTTVPVYLLHITRDLASDYFIWFWYPGITLNTCCFPALWFFVRSQLDRSFRLNVRNLLHALPTLVSLFASIIFYAPLSVEEIEAERAYMEAGGENLPAIINDVILFGQFFIYYTAIFIYIHRRKKHLRDNYSDTNYNDTHWITCFLIVFFVLFLVVFVAYIINPRTDAWLIPILNIMAMGYLVYIVIRHCATACINRLLNTPIVIEKDKKADMQPAMSEQQMKEICDIITQYLQSSKAYTNPDFSIHILSRDTDIHLKKISAAINGYMHKNFFEFINAMRIEEAKRLLMTLDTGYTIESISIDCGFRSRSSFFMTFRKFEDTSPAQWLKENKERNPT